MKFVDCYVAAVRAEQKSEYARYVTETSQIFHDAGAESIFEGWGVDVPEGKLTSLPMAVKAEAGEVVVLGWIVWPSKEVRDAGMPVAMARMQEHGAPPFDGKRMIFGGFETIYAG